MKNKNLIYLIFLGFSLFSCNNSKNNSVNNSEIVNEENFVTPEEITKEFYALMNKGKYDEAKIFANPSAVEYIDKIKELSKNNAEDKEEFILMDVVKKQTPEEGDTATVNYKLGEYKNDIKLVFTNGKYKVIYTYTLQALKIREFESMDFYKMLNTLSDDEINENYVGFRFRIKNIIAVNVPAGYALGYPYDAKTNTSSAAGDPLNYYPESNDLYVNNVKVNRPFIGGLEGLGHDDDFAIYTINSKEQKKIENKSPGFASAQKVSNVIDIQGRLASQYGEFQECSVYKK